MIFSRRLKHPLPKVPNNVRPTFRNACEALPPEALEELSEMVTRSLERTRDEAATSPRIDIRMAEEIASRCRLLLEHYEEFSKEERALVVGAVRYFVIDEDPFSDDVFASGFDDDARVVNHVLEQLGIEGMYIEFL